MAELLITKGANVNARSDNGLTPLHRASQVGNRNVVELLLSKGATIDVKDNDGSTPRMCGKFPPGAPPKSLRGHRLR